MAVLFPFYILLPKLYGVFCCPGQGRGEGEQRQGTENGGSHSETEIKKLQLLGNSIALCNDLDLGPVQLGQNLRFHSGGSCEKLLLFSLESDLLPAELAGGQMGEFLSAQGRNRPPGIYMAAFPLFFICHGAVPPFHRDFEAFPWRGKSASEGF